MSVVETPQGAIDATLLAVIYVPGAAALFRFAAPAPLDLALAAGIALLGVAWDDAVKIARSRRRAFSA